jgi:hypothetical protein
MWTGARSRGCERADSIDRKLEEMHPFLAIPAALVGYLVGRRAAGRVADPKTSRSVVTTGAWERFVSAMEQAPKDRIGRKGKLGAFQIDARRLADVGVMRKAWKRSDGTWTGEWAGRLTQDGFLGSMPVQYAAFVRSMKSAAPKVVHLVGADVGGEAATLSGLLGVSHLAGERGVGSFVGDLEIRKRFPGTVDIFHRTNGIF